MNLLLNPPVKLLYAGLFLLLFSTSTAFGQTTLNSHSSEDRITLQSYKDYDDGSRIGYFQLKGEFSQEELAEMKKKISTTAGILRVSFFDNKENTPIHTIQIKSASGFISKEWLSALLFDSTETPEGHE